MARHGGELVFQDVGDSGREGEKVNPVILSGVAASQREEATKSKDPKNYCADTKANRYFHDGARSPERIPFCGAGSVLLQGVLRLDCHSLHEWQSALRMTVLE